MFARLSSAIVLALPLLAAATAVPRTNGHGPPNQCNTGPVQCCNSIQSSSNPTAAITTLLGLLGVVVGDLTGQIGVTCTPITGIGASGTSCDSQPVCCTGNSFNGVVALGCSPINVNI